MSGTLYGVGVGPGDPELMTLKAVRIVASVPVIAVIGADGRASRAWGIAGRHVRSDAVVLQHAMPMRCERAAGEAVYAALAEQIDPHLQAGHDVAFLCEGDPLFYGSFLGLLDEAHPHWRIEVVPGVSSVMAAAARALRPLARREEPLTVVPATAPRDVLHEAARSPGMLVVLKVGRHLETVRAVLADAGRLDAALLAEEVGGERERVRPLREVEVAPYFSLILAGGAPA